MTPLTGESLDFLTSNRQDDARLDIKACSFWRREDAYFDIRIMQRSIQHYNGKGENVAGIHIVGGENRGITIAIPLSEGLHHSVDLKRSKSCLSRIGWYIQTLTMHLESALQRCNCIRWLSRMEHNIYVELHTKPNKQRLWPSTSTSTSKSTIVQTI